MLTGRHFSTIDSMRSRNEHQFSNERRFTLSGSNSSTVVMAPHPEIPTIVTTTEAHQESQESSAAALPDDDKYFLINSSPSTQSIVSSILSEPPQVADQTKNVTTTIRPLQYYHSSHLRYENKHFCTGSSVSLHPAVSRMISEPITKENLSASCSWLEVPSQRPSHQWYNSPPDPSSNNMSQVSEHYSDIIMKPTLTTPHCAQHPSNISPPATSQGHDTKHFQRPPSLKCSPAFMNDEHSNTSPSNGNCMTIHPRILLGHPMSRSMSQEYNCMPHSIRNGHGFHRAYVSQLNPSPAGHGMPRYAVTPEVVPRSSYSETDMPYASMCNCQCPHCGKFRSRDASMAHDQHIRVPYIPVVCTHKSESLNQLQTHVHPPNHHGEVPNISSLVEISNSGTKRVPESSGSGECGSKSSINQQSTIQRKENQNPDESGSESEHQINTNANYKPNQATVRAEDQGSHSKPANSMRPLESSKKKKISKQRRPHSATAGAGNAATTTSAKHNLHASADTLAESYSKGVTIIVINIIMHTCN